MARITRFELNVNNLVRRTSVSLIEHNISGEVSSLALVCYWRHVGVGVDIDIDERAGVDFEVLIEVHLMGEGFIASFESADKRAEIEVNDSVMSLERVWLFVRLNSFTTPRWTYSFKLLSTSWFWTCVILPCLSTSYRPKLRALASIFHCRLGSTPLSLFPYFLILILRPFGPVGKSLHILCPLIMDLEVVPESLGILEHPTATFLVWADRGMGGFDMCL
jgi:hypothetical protein